MGLQAAALVLGAVMQKVLLAMDRNVALVGRYGGLSLDPPRLIRSGTLCPGVPGVGEKTFWLMTSPRTTALVVISMSNLPPMHTLLVMVVLPLSSLTQLCSKSGVGP